MKKYKVILFDVDNTLFDFDKDQYVAYFNAMKECGINCTEDMYNDYYQINRGLWHKLDDGMISLDSLLVERHRLFFNKYNIDIDAFSFDRLLTLKFRDTGTLIPGVKEVLDTLYGDYELIIVSNSPMEQQYHRLRNADILYYFSKIFLSEEVGYSKPDIRFFEAVFNSIKNIDKSEILIIGDSISSDILGGINAGIDTCWYNPKRKVKRLNIEPNYEITDYKELSMILNK